MATIDTTSYRSPNHNARPGGISAIVIHTGEGTKKSDLDTLLDDTVPEDERVSAHYYVDRVANIYQLVPDLRRAWHAGASRYLGLSNWNDFSIGIETEHKAGQNWPTAQRTALAWLCARLIERYRIEQRMVVAHRWIAPGRKSDPSNWPDPELRAWIAALYPPPIVRYQVAGLPCYRRADLTDMAVTLPTGATVEIDATSGPGYAPGAGHVRRAAWGDVVLEDPGFVDMDGLGRV